MQANDYDWWKKRFNVIARYFDAMRIDHILGFFRIWRMPMSATQGLLGYFYPAVPVTLEEFASRHIPLIMTDIADLLLMTKFFGIGLVMRKR